MPFKNPVFIDHHSYDTGTGYASPNENVDVYNELLGDRKFNKAICICSSGEVLLSVVIPRCKQVVAVDHSYISLANAYRKAVALLQHGKREEVLDAILKNRDAMEAKAWFDKFPMPDKLKSRVTMHESSYKHQDLQAHWRMLESRLAKIPKRRIANTVFLHGDWQDALELYGQCDLFYVSNALDHCGRNGFNSKLRIMDLAKFLVPGGVLIGAGLPPIRYCGDAFDELCPAKICSSRHGHIYSWTYSALVRK